jgi:regulator of RNase E activity RraA
MFCARFTVQMRRERNDVMPVGFEIYRDIPRPSAELIEAFRGVASADLVDVMHKRGSVDPAIRPVYRPMLSVVGPAVTISVPDAAFSIVKAGLEMTRAGDVVVINARGSLDFALVGGNVCRGLKARGVAAFLADGSIRDVSEIREDGLPVFARGIALQMGPIPGAGEVNVPIAFGGVVVNPGDIIVADEDGIAVVPPHMAHEVLAAAHALHEGHQAAQPALLRGEVTGVAAILDQIIKDGGVIHDGSHVGGEMRSGR